MAKVAILGSCITRDLWSGRGDSFPDLLYVSRTSLPSIMAKPVEGVVVSSSPPPGLGPFQHRALITDLDKTALERLAAFAPTHLVVDFIDERYDLLCVDGGAMANATWELETSGYLAQPPFARAQRISRFSQAYEELWREGLQRFAAFVSGTPLAEARLILHSARWAEAARGPDGRIAPLPTRETPDEIAAQNALLARYEALFNETFSGLARVEAPQRRLADAAHVWGLSPFHYVPEYYREIARQLAELGVEVAVPAAAGT